eukprot:TRINITY_DN4237_c0_g1_i3.p1 TRINITY_DN4237_c0_g1~~TRINITY_DN4237_c0_g1_i3.p1  ORF type:complete len:210 (-),score=15.38 TRINITY_DN4237_c0_g1_i3:470-1039(-)
MGHVVDNRDQVFKILLLGDSGAGKSSLLVRFADNQFESEYSTTIGIDFKMRRFQDPATGSVCALQLWDSAGQERFRSITTTYYRHASAIMLVYDVTSRLSFTRIPEWVEQIKLHADKGVKILLVGNKCDLSSMRTVTTEEGEKMAKDLGFLFLETSAKEDLHVKDAFISLASQVMNSRDPSPFSLLPQW